GLMLVKRNVAGVQALPTESAHATDGSAGTHAHQKEAATARVVVASGGLVVVETTVRDIGDGGISQTAANGGADLAISARAAGGFGTADGLVGRERAAAQIERPEVHNATATGAAYGVCARAGAAVAALAG